MGMLTIGEVARRAGLRTSASALLRGGRRTAARGAGPWPAAL